MLMEFMLEHGYDNINTDMQMGWVQILLKARMYVWLFHKIFYNQSFSNPRSST
jgi:hypothetical protein